MKIRIRREKEKELLTPNEGMISSHWLTNPGKNKRRYSLVFVEDFETRRTAVCLLYRVFSVQNLQLDWSHYAMPIVCWLYQPI